MHDLQFVRANLALVEEKLRARGQDPAALLGNFAALDAERRERITEAETLKARRNVLSEEVGRKKRAKEDATALMEETRQLKEKLEALDASASDMDERLRGILASIPNLAHNSVPAGTSEHDNVEEKQWGTKPHFDFAPRPHSASSTSNARRNSLARASLSTGTRVRAWNVHSPISCWTSTPASTTTARYYPP
jgi:seryl-tRNA synthetase